VLCSDFCIDRSFIASAPEVITFEVWDKDTLSSDDLLGSATLVLSELDETQPTLTLALDTQGSIELGVGERHVTPAPIKNDQKALETALRAAIDGADRLVKAVGAARSLHALLATARLPGCAFDRLELVVLDTLGDCYRTLGDNERAWQVCRCCNRCWLFFFFFFFFCVCLSSQNHHPIACSIMKHLLLSQKKSTMPRFSTILAVVWSIYVPR
jgi:hypothetical protein